jgi:DNA-binding response OmpR family regulator
LKKRCIDLPAVGEFVASTKAEFSIMSQTILVAEDQQPVRSLIEFKLKNSGYTVVCVEDGRAALQKARELKPDLILLDVMMPLMTGFEVLGALRQEENTKKIPILMVTAQSNEEEVLKGLELGADDYITKPFSPNELAARVKTVLLRKSRT